MAIDTYRSRLAHGEEITFTQPRGKMILLLVIAIIFTLVGIVLAASGDLMPMIGGWAAILFFGVIGIPTFIIKIVRPTPQLVVSAERGVWLAQGDRSWLPWQEIEAVTLGEINRQKMVALAVSRQLYDRRFAGSSAAMRGLAAANEKIIGGPALAIPTSLGIKPTELAEWLAVEHEERVVASPGH